MPDDQSESKEQCLVSANGGSSVEDDDTQQAATRTQCSDGGGPSVMAIDEKQGKPDDTEEISVAMDPRGFVRITERCVDCIMPCCVALDNMRSRKFFCVTEAFEK